MGEGSSTNYVNAYRWRFDPSTPGRGVCGMKMPTQNVVFKFRRPSGPGQSHPSAAMHEALMLLSEADELQTLFQEASKAGKFVAIHFTKEAV